MSPPYSPTNGNHNLLVPQALPCALFVCFGIGDLVKVKVADAIVNLLLSDKLHPSTRILFAALEDYDDETFRNILKKDPAFFITTANRGRIDEVLSRIHYQRLNFKVPGDFAGLKTRIDELLVAEHETVAFYYATWSKFYPDIAANLRNSGCLDCAAGDRRQKFHHFLEKPVGNDFESARDILDKVGAAAHKENVFIIDHYIGKDMVRNLLVLLCENQTIFPTLNNCYVERVVIRAMEKIGVGERGTEYDMVGALKDMIVPHLMQMLALFTMDRPRTIAELPVRKLETLRSFTSATAAEAVQLSVFGQYTWGLVDNQTARGYRQEPGVKTSSTTPTFAAIRLFSESDRWKGVPFDLISGKRTHQKQTLIEVMYLPIRDSLFASAGATRRRQRLSIRVQPDPALIEDFIVKAPGRTWQATTMAERAFSWKEHFKEDPRYEYETILLEAMRGLGELFESSDTMLESWRIATPFIVQQEQVEPRMYSAGESGPAGVIQGASINYSNTDDFEV